MVTHVGKVASHGIKTMFHGVMYRSRLEAKWAAVFESLKWPVTYEPFDLNSYVPDFIADFEHSHVLIEIKPELSDEALCAAKRKIEASGWDGEALILSGRTEFCAIQPRIGDFAEPENGPDGKQLVWTDGFMFRCINCGLTFPCGSKWDCRNCGAHEGNSHVGDVGEELREAWFAAGNLVQWRAA
jgi:hypothetical protein